MSGVQNQIKEQVSHAIALLGGATAQSYKAVSLNALSAATDMGGTESSPDLAGLANNQLFGDVELTSQSLEKLLADGLVAAVSVASAALNATEETKESNSGFTALESQNPELMSRFDVSSPDGEGALAAQQSGFPSATLGADESLETNAFGGSDFSLLDFIEQAIAQAEASQSEFDGTFDGSRQGKLREFVVDTGTELGSETRGLLKENLDGTGRNLLSSTIDETGIQLLDPVLDPLLGVDYYAESAQVLNSVLDALTQPIGSIALPKLGPLLTELRDEFHAYLG